MRCTLVMEQPPSADNDAVAAAAAKKLAATCLAQLLVEVCGAGG